MSKEATTTTETATAENKGTLTNNNESPFTTAANMNINSAVGVLAQASQLAQKAGVLTVNDAVLVARALEIVSKPNEAAK
ncbi:MAG: hypothetical protein CMP57_03900 [Flavobacteriales bacterium]|nr:hypothetical protein [Flavobacteriales bacterium]|tara:strand:- start:2400 stop:2639 length:240 start_codon:yes stop_codon:yes gene_type:complete